LVVVVFAQGDLWGLAPRRNLPKEPQRICLVALLLPGPCDLKGLLAEGHRLRQAADQATTHYQQALALAEALGMRPLQAHCHRGLGMWYARTGQQEQARAELSTAIALYRAMDMTFWLPQTEAALAQMEGG